MDPEIQRMIDDIQGEIRELTLVMRNLGNVLSATADQEIEAFGKQLNRTTSDVKNFNSAIVDQFGRELKSSAQAAQDAAEADREKTEAAKDAAKADRENFVYRRRERSAFRDLSQEMSTTRGALGRLQESALQRAAGNDAAESAILLGTAALEGLGKAALQTARDLYAGQQGAVTLAKSVETFSGTVTTAAQGVGLAMMLLGGPLSVIGAGLAALSAVISIFTKGITLAADQSDKLFDSFQELQKAGANASTGLAGVFTMMQDFSLGLDDLAKMNSLLAENAAGLAIFGGSVSDGARNLGLIGREIKTSGLRGEFMRLGLTVDEINAGMAGYVDIQSRLGRTQTMTTGQITKSIAAYIRETDAITRLTGATRKEQEDAQKKAMAIEQFRFRINQLVSQGDAASLAEADRLNSTFRMLNKISPQLAEGFAQMTTGFVTEGGVGAFLISNAEALRVATDSSLSAAQGVEIIGRAAEQGLRGPLGSLAQFGQFNKTLGLSYGELSDAAVATRDFEARLRAVNGEQDRLTKNTETGVDAQVNMRESQMNSRDSLQSFVNIGVNPATRALSTLADVVEGLTQILPGGSRPGTGMNTPGYGAQGTGTRGGSVASTGAGAAAGAIAGSVVPGVGTAIGGIVGGILGYIGYGALGGITDRPEDLLDFGGNSGSLANFRQLDSHMQERVLAAAKQYFDVTGNKLQVNSAFRSPEDQRRLYAEYIARGRTGMPVAPPGSSAHESGQAIDIQQGKGDPQAIRSLNAAGLFQTVPNDPVHFAMKGSGYADGGIATGPRSGYSTVLHGTEAIVPLPDGRSIPVENQDAEFAAPRAPVKVEIPGYDSAMTRQMDAMAQQITRLDTLINIMRDQASISSKILQVSQN